MTGFLFDTWLATGVLIAVVLLIRRPMAHLFGARLAYALWLLPALRFLMPPIVLPAWLAPERQVPLFAQKAPPVHPSIVDADTGTASFADAAVQSGTGGDILGLVAMAVWLGGAVVFCVWRMRNYRAMRARLLGGAVPVGEVGDIRMVESREVAAPLAFGIRDKVIAMPVNFMSQPSREARDFAIAHEIAHHRRGDLLANILAQPVPALHWFNPVAWLGWRAMRRDQEAACDAHVMAGKSRPERARYGEVIVLFAREQHMALAAPMAGFREIGPALGEKAIVHRLRSLTQEEGSTRRRRAGRMAIAGAVLVALPLSATISFAEGEQAEYPAPAAPPLPAAPPSPVPPAAPPMPANFVQEPTGEDMPDTWDGADRLAHEARIEAEASRTEAEAEAFESEMEAFEAEIEQLGPMIAKSVRAAMKVVPDIDHTVSSDGDGKRHVTRLFGVDDEGRRQVVQTQVVDERAIEREAYASAISAVRAARRSIAASRSIPADVRTDTLRELDQELHDMEEEFRSADRGD
ncbi:M56 family metallopeptidase [Croceicoccus hydrothermalis]|uniref:M56 family metallopeptidase n=1 Tax=Croceicoccus hydrothermalis TaxID=2867964 RepID=UPI001EFACDDC|nr:M56 family metallopeptidase [Croceicoccus hydrothermalis]